MYCEDLIVWVGTTAKCSINENDTTLAPKKMEIMFCSKNENAPIVILMSYVVITFPSQYPDIINFDVFNIVWNQRDILIFGSFQLT